MRNEEAAHALPFCLPRCFKDSAFRPAAADFRALKGAIFDLNHRSHAEYVQIIFSLRALVGRGWSACSKKVSISMLKRILLLLGETRASVAARRYAFHLAKDAGAEMAGLAGVDLSFIEAPMAGGIGTTAYKVRLEEQLKRQAADARARLHDAYEQECIAQSVPFEWLSFDGDPIGILRLAAETCDLVVTGHDTAFHGDVHEELPEMLATLLLMTPRPVIVCGDDTPEGHDILIAYDGSLPAMRAIQLFALLGLGAGWRVHVISTNADKELAARGLQGAAGYLRKHGYEVEASPIATTVHPAEVLRIEVADHKIATLVMGAYGHRGFRERLFGSTTVRLVENPPCALFLCH